MGLFNILRSSISGEKLSDDERNDCSSDQLHNLLEISRKHDLEHLLAFGLKQNELIPTTDKEIEKNIFKAAYRYERMRYASDILCSILEKTQIPFLPLKGLVIRKYYPEPWMRTSCDIDILVHKEDLEKAKKILVNDCGYIYQKTSPHDVTFVTSANIHIELHYDLIEEGRVNRSAEILKTVWNTATVRDGFSFWYEMPDEMFYFYHIAHMAKHFVEGGCGVRPFIDLWILDNIKEVDGEKRNKLLKKGDLLNFADVVRKLSRIWFENEGYDFVSKQMEEYILHGGVYGNDENRIAVQQHKKGGKLRYAFSKIWIPYDKIKFHYPILEKYKWLTPIMQIRRWCKLVFMGHLKRATKELKYNSSVSKDKAAETKNFLSSIGL